MDANILKDLDKQKHDLLELVNKETAWEQAKCQISLEKLKSK